MIERLIAVSSRRIWHHSLKPYLNLDKHYFFKSFLLLDFWQGTPGTRGKVILWVFPALFLLPLPSGYRRWSSHGLAVLFVICHFRLEQEVGTGGTTYTPNSLLRGGRNRGTTGFLLLATPSRQTRRMVKEMQKLLPQKWWGECLGVHQSWQMPL